MKKRKRLTVAVIIAVVTAFIFDACAPLREFGRTPFYQGANNFAYPLPAYDSVKKTVVIVANNDGTELFDMMAPYYLFNATEKANVYIVTKEKYPIVVKKGLFLLPQSTFREIDSLRINPDVIVIPYLSVGDSLHQDPVVVNWIKKHYTTSVNILAVCDGAATAAATGLFDGKPITAHAADYNGIKTSFRKPLWVQNTSVAGNGNLLSTAGVSNAVEGSLAVIGKLFGAETLKEVMENIAYPYASPKTVHESNTFHFGDKVAIGKKIVFRKNKKIGVLLQNGMSEFALAGVMDTYNRTFPRSIESFSAGDAVIKTKFGLTLLPTGKLDNSELDELHVIHPLLFSNADKANFNSAEVVRYDNLQRRYIIDVCLDRINDEYGEKFENIVRLMLDYN